MSKNRIGAGICICWMGFILCKVWKNSRDFDRAMDDEFRRKAVNVARAGRLARSELSKPIPDIAGANEILARADDEWQEDIDADYRILMHFLI